MPPRILTIAGSDSSAGAGIQADIKTIMALGGYATTAITALTAQDTHGVHGVFAVPPAFVARQMQLVLADIGTDAFKTGMLGDAATIDAVADIIAAHPAIPYVLDPVMQAKGGHALLAPEALAALHTRLLPLASIVTPNAPEAEALSGLPLRGAADVAAVGNALLAGGARAVLLKGGHLEGDIVTDWLITQAGTSRFSAPRRHTRHTHGTGCTLASAIAVFLAQGMALEPAIRRAHAYLQAALARAPGFGAGHGPLGH